MWEAEVVPRRRGQCPRRGQCEEPALKRKRQRKGRVSVGEGRARTKGHIRDQCPEEEDCGGGKVSAQACSVMGSMPGCGALWGKRAGLRGRGQWWGRYSTREGTVQAFLFPIVTSWQIPKLKGPSSGDIQQGRAGRGRP